jgi:hypothetical protein
MHGCTAARALILEGAPPNQALCCSRLDGWLAAGLRTLRYQEGGTASIIWWWPMLSLLWMGTAGALPDLFRGSHFPGTSLACSYTHTFLLSPSPCSATRCHFVPTHYLAPCMLACSYEPSSAVPRARPARLAPAGLPVTHRSQHQRLCAAIAIVTLANTSQCCRGSLGPWHLVCACVYSSPNILYEKTVQVVRRAHL